MEKISTLGLTWLNPKGFVVSWPTFTSSAKLDFKLITASLAPVSFWFSDDRDSMSYQLPHVPPARHLTVFLWPCHNVKKTNHE